MNSSIPQWCSRIINSGTINPTNIFPHAWFKKLRMRNITTKISKTVMSILLPMMRECISIQAHCVTICFLAVSIEIVSASGHRMNLVLHPLIFKDIRRARDEKRYAKVSIHPTSPFETSISICANERGSFPLI